LGQKLLSVLPTNKEMGLFDKYKGVVETGQNDTFEQYYPGENIQRWFRVSAVKLNDGFTVTFQDISDLKEAVLQVEDKEKKYQRLFEESIDAIFLVDEKFKFLDSNPALHQLFGFKTDELDNSLENLFYQKGDFDQFKKLLINQGKIDEMEVTLKDKQNRKKSCLINSAPILDAKKKKSTYIGVIRDMTKRKLADRELLQAEKLSMTGKIARTIAHEVRNPLTNLTLALEQLKDEVPQEVEDAELYFNIISRNVDRISKLISDLLNSSKPKELNLQVQSLNALVTDALNLVKDRLNLQSINLKEKYDPSLPLIPLDSDQIKIALLNLFINAIEAMKPKIGELSVTTSGEDGIISLTIQDNGTGINKENLEKLFEPFFTGKKEGTGLGLTTAQNIIQSHRGKIKAESEVGLGTTFIIKFSTNL